MTDKVYGNSSYAELHGAFLGLKPGKNALDYATKRGPAKAKELEYYTEHEDLLLIPPRSKTIGIEFLLLYTDAAIRWGAWTRSGKMFLTWTTLGERHACKREITACTQQLKTASHDPAATDLALWYDIKDVANSEKIVERRNHQL